MRFRNWPGQRSIGRTGKQFQLTTKHGPAGKAGPGSGGGERGNGGRAGCERRIPDVKKKKKHFAGFSPPFTFIPPPPQLIELHAEPLWSAEFWPESSIFSLLVFFLAPLLFFSFFFPFLFFERYSSARLPVQYLYIRMTGA